jgi:hypothetical protein
LIRSEDIKQHLDTLKTPNAPNATTGVTSMTHITDLASFAIIVYGTLEGPIVRGMERDQMHHDTVSPKQRYTAVAGMFNTGTNAMEHHLRHNLVQMRRTWQVPRGKHLKPFDFLSHKANGLKKDDCYEP